MNRFNEDFPRTLHGIKHALIVGMVSRTIHEQIMANVPFHLRLFKMLYKKSYEANYTEQFNKFLNSILYI